MFKLPYSCSHFTRWQDNTQNPSSQASAVRDLKTSRCISWIQNGRGTRDQIANIHWIIEKERESPHKKKNSTSVSLTTLKPLTILITTICGKFLKRWEYQTIHHTCLQRNLYADNEATVRTKRGPTDWFQIGKGVCQGCSHPAYLTYMQSTSCKMQ